MNTNFRKVLLGIIMALLPLVLFAQASGGQITHKKQSTHKKKKVINSSKNNNESTPIIDFSFKPTPTIPKKTDIRPIPFEKMCYYNIVVSSYNLLPDAQTECQKIRDEGYTSEIFMDSSNIYRVLMYMGTNSEQDAQRYIKKARVKYPNAWILCVDKNGHTYRYNR